MRRITTQLMPSLCLFSSALLTLPAIGQVRGQLIESPILVLDSYWNYFGPKPFEHFVTTDSGDAIENALLLSYLSDEVYPREDESYSENWVEAKTVQFSHEGLEMLDYISEPSTGTEVAVLQRTGALIIVFRGSHAGDSNSWFDYSDWLADINGTAIQRTIGGESVYVHEGFWYTFNSVYPQIREFAIQARNEGRSIWLAGHSLGGANATLTAAKLQYEDGIAVQGLHTFGSPRVGNIDFQKLCDEAGPGGAPPLADGTRRWVVEGDWATTLFLYYRQWRFTWSWWTMSYVPTSFTINYHHMGQANLLQPYSNGTLAEVDYDVAEDRDMAANLSSLNLDGEHLMYTNLLQEEMDYLLTLAGETEVRDDLNTLEIR